MLLGYAVALPYRKALRATAIPGLRPDVPFANTCREPLSVRPGNEIDGEVQSRGPPRAGETVAIDDVEAAQHFDPWKGLGECGLVVPVYRATVVVQQAGAGKN